MFACSDVCSFPGTGCSNPGVINNELCEDNFGSPTKDAWRSGALARYGSSRIALRYAALFTMVQAACDQNSISYQRNRYTEDDHSQAHNFRSPSLNRGDRNDDSRPRSRRKKSFRDKDELVGEKRPARIHPSTANELIIVASTTPRALIREPACPTRMSRLILNCRVYEPAVTHTCSPAT